MSPLFHAHSGIRYLILLAGVAVVAYSLYGLLTRRAVDKPMRILGAIFAGTLHLQILVGVALIFSGRFGSGVGPHVLTMLFAAAVAQIVPSVMRRRRPEARSWGPYLVGAVVSLGLIAAGIIALGRPVVG